MKWHAPKIIDITETETGQQIMKEESEHRKAMRRLAEEVVCDVETEHYLISDDILRKALVDHITIQLLEAYELASCC